MARLLAFYLPQFHPIAENDAWWGRGFTEWRNVVAARPLFKGHYQPHLPADLGFYDLRVPETRAAQANLAREHGLYGFCYYHYWFNGHVLLDRPLRENLERGEPDLPFCMCWANENWTRAWDGSAQQVLIKQDYSPEDDVAHIRWLIPYFWDRRYVTVRGKPVLLIYRSKLIPDTARMAAIWREEVRRAGLPGIYLIRVESNFPGETGPLDGTGFDAAAEFQPRTLSAPVEYAWLLRRFRRAVPRPFRENRIRDYRKLVRDALSHPEPGYKRYRCVTPSWDNTSRRAARGLPATIYLNSSPELYERWLAETLRSFTPYGQDEDFVFVNAWNEWAEGNHLEPDQRYGRAYLEATRNAIRAAV